MPTSRLVGVITVDDVVEVMQEEASEDILRMGGVAGESVSDPVLQTTQAPLPLAVRQSAAPPFSPRWVISLFDATIQQMVALAVLMPIVASMGGNAGTQTMTVAVRALATQELGTVNALEGHRQGDGGRPPQRASLRADHGGHRLLLVRQLPRLAS